MATETWREVIAPDEEAKFERLAKQLVTDGKDGRTLHRRAHVGLAGTLVVKDGLPAAAAQGLFAKPGTYECYARFSAGAGKAQPDRAPDVRGLALKVVGVPGKKVIPGLEDATTQDFLLILSRTFAFKDPQTFVDVVSTLQRGGGPLSVLGVLVKAVGFFGALGMASALSGAQDKGKHSLAEHTFFGPLPIRWGDSAGRVRLRPLGEGSAPANVAPGDDGLTSELAQRVARTALSYALEVQLFVDEARTPIEDPTVDWTDDVAPFVEVARLELPIQDTTSARGQAIAAAIEKMSFDPWHALDAHKPLGANMRMRGVAYRVSTQARSATSELEVVPPSGIDSGAPKH